MRNKRFIAPAIALRLVNAVAVGASPIEIQSVNARLFLGHTGTLSSPLTEKDALWNTIIGGGSAREPSNSTLIDVIVKGSPGDFDPHWTIDIVVTNSKTGVVTRKLSQRAGGLSAIDEYHVAFWLTGTGCEPLHIVATIRKTSQSKKRILDSRVENSDEPRA